MNFLFLRADADVNETRTSCFDCYNCIRTVNVSGMVTIHCVVHVPRCMIQVYSATSQEPKLRISYLLQRSPILNWEWKTHERIIVNAGRRNLSSDDNQNYIVGIIKSWLLAHCHHVWTALLHIIQFQCYVTVSACLESTCSEEAMWILFTYSFWLPLINLYMV